MNQYINIKKKFTAHNETITKFQNVSLCYCSKYLSYLIKIQLFVYFILFSNPQFTYAQDRRILFDHISIEDGLSQSSVFALCQDYKGFLWIGTHDGLNRFDGYSFVVFKNHKNDSTSISGNIIRTIYECRDKSLWIGTFGYGLNLFDRNTETFTRFVNVEGDDESLSFNTIYSIFEDKRGFLWIATYGGGLNRFDRKTRKFKRYLHDENNPNSISHNNVVSVAEDKMGMIWIATEKGLDCLNPTNDDMIHFNSTPQSPIPLISSVLTSLYIDKKNRIWIGTNSGLHVYDPQNIGFKTYKKDFPKKNGLSHSTILKILEDSRGYFWIGTSEGLNIYDPHTDKFSSYKHNPENSKSISNNNIASICEDNAGIIWIGTWERGLNRFDHKAAKFPIYQHNPDVENSLPDKTVRAIYKDKADNIWLGFVSGGLYCFNRKDSIFDRYESQPDKNGLHDNNITSIFHDSRGDLWVGTWNKGLHKAVFNRNKKNKIERFIHYSRLGNGLINDTIQKITEDSKGRLWIGTAIGLDMFEPQTGKFTHYINKSGADEGSIQSAMAFDKDGFLWVGSWGGLYRINTDLPPNQDIKRFVLNPKDTTSISDNRIISLCISKDGTLWAGTFGGGLNKITVRKDGSLFCKRYREEDGLSNNVIYALFDDEAGNIWMSTNKGISNLITSTGKFVNYDENDGLQSNEFFWGAAAKGLDGEIFFGGIKGVNAFYPKNIFKNSFIPPIVFTDFKLFNISVSIGENSILKHSITETDEIVLSHEDKVVSFEFSALHFSVPAKNKYAYKLVGFHDKWIYTDARKRFVTFTNLDPGTYTLMIKGTNSDEVWNENGVKINIIVKPPYWKSWWFRTLTIVLAMSLIFAFFMVRINIIHAQKCELERLVEERTHELTVKSTELEQQKEEIQTQAEALELKNDELEHQKIEILKQADKLEVTNTELEQQKTKVTDQNSQIKSSIEYAKRIQEAMLNFRDNFDNYFQSFIIFKPKDIVSGDFYWFSKISNVIDEPNIEPTEYVFVAVVDCTGHGVPGAFMSLIGNRLLNEVVLERGILTPKDILFELNKELRLALWQDKADDLAIVDGMDLSLCRFEKQTDNVAMIYAGAKSFIYHYKISTCELEIIKSDRISVGGTSNNVLPNYTQIEFVINTGDIIYFMTDGIIDQNDTLRHRFGTKRMTDTLKQIADQPIDQQAESIENIIMNYQKTEFQRDDMTLLGLKIV